MGWPRCLHFVLRRHHGDARALSLRHSVVPSSLRVGANHRIYRYLCIGWCNDRAGGCRHSRQPIEVKGSDGKRGRAMKLLDLRLGLGTAWPPPPDGPYNPDDQWHHQSKMSPLQSSGASRPSLQAQEWFSRPASTCRRLSTHQPTPCALKIKLTHYRLPEPA